MLNDFIFKLMDTTTTTEETTTSTTEASNQVVDWTSLRDEVVDWCKNTGLRIIIGLILLFILIKLTNKLARHIRNRMVKGGAEKTITSVVYQVISIGFKVVWLLLFLGFIGVETASVGTIIASLGVAVGLAVQGSLSNLAGGIMILVTRPFRVGDFITAQGQSGTVEDIRFFYTHLVTTDNKAIMIPNGTLASGVIVNVNAKPERRVDEVFSISYEADYTKACKLITEIINKNELVLKDKDIFVRMSEHADSAINITVRVWTKTSDYWNVHFYLLEEVKKAFDKNNIEIPYNKLDVNLKKEN